MALPSARTLLGAVRMESRPLDEFRASDVLVLDLHEIVAGKVVALIDRHVARDLFDARRILSFEGLDWRWIKAALFRPSAPAVGSTGEPSRPAPSRVTHASFAKSSPFACRATASPAWERSRRGSRRPFRSAGKSSPSCSICRRRSGNSSTAFSTTARSMPICSMSIRQYAAESKPCRCSPGRLDTSRTLHQLVVKRLVRDCRAEQRIESSLNIGQVSTGPVTWPASKLMTSRYGFTKRSRRQKPIRRPRSLRRFGDNTRLIWLANWVTVLRPIRVSCVMRVWRFHDQRFRMGLQRFEQIP